MWTQDTERRFRAILEEIKRLCAEGTQGHGDEFYGPILDEVAKLEKL